MRLRPLLAVATLAADWIGDYSLQTQSTGSITYGGTDPFGFAIDDANIANENPDVVGTGAPAAVVNGPFGAGRVAFWGGGGTGAALANGGFDSGTTFWVDDVAAG